MQLSFQNFEKSTKIWRQGAETQISIEPAVLQRTYVTILIIHKFLPWCSPEQNAWFAVIDLFHLFIDFVPQSQKYTYKRKINMFCAEEHWRYLKWISVAPCGLKDVRLCLFSVTSGGTEIIPRGWTPLAIERSPRKWLKYFMWSPDTKNRWIQTPPGAVLLAYVAS